MLDQTLKLGKLERSVRKTIRMFQQFDDPADPYFQLSTYLPDLKVVLENVQRVRTEAITNQSPRGTLAIFGGLAHNHGAPANLLNTEYTVGLRFNENPKDATWAKAWNRMQKIRRRYEFTLAECYRQIGLP